MRLSIIAGLKKAIWASFLPAALSAYDVQCASRRTREIIRSYVDGAETGIEASKMRKLYKSHRRIYLSDLESSSRHTGK